MKKFIVTLLVLIVIGGGLAMLLNQNSNVLGTVTPLAEDAFKTTAQYKETFDKSTTGNYPPNEYFPRQLTPTINEMPDIQAKSFAVMDRKTGELILAKNITEELPIASVTKIMTALVTLENADVQKEIRVSETAANIGESEMGLSAGELVSVEKLLYGIMLPSGNDAAEALAEGALTGRTSFIIKMNETAQRLGLFDTFYFNPSGLDGETLETTSFSTALDLLALTNYALTNETFADIASTYYKEFPYAEGKHKAFYLYNILQMDRSYPGLRGVKPGNTEFALETLVSYAVNGNRELIVVLLGMEHSRDEAIKLYDFVYQKLGMTIPGRTL